MAQLTIKSCSRSRVAPLQLQKLHCPVVKRKMWTEEAMDNATKDVMEGTLSVRRAATHYDILPSTLHDRISGKVSTGAVSGAPHYLDEDEEKELVDFPIGMCRSWLPKNCKGSQSNSW